MVTEIPNSAKNGAQLIAAEVIVVNEQALLLGRVAAAEILRDSLDSQMALMASGRFDNFKEKKGIGFLNAFLSDPLFAEIYAQAKSEALTAQDDLGFKKGFRGAIFERMCFAYLSSLDTHAVPVMGEEVLDVLKVLYPNPALIDSGFGHIGIQGVYVPDGFFLKRKSGAVKVTGVIECSLGRWDMKLTKDDQLYGSRKLIEKLGPLAQAPVLYIATPILDHPVDLSLEQSRIPLISAVLPFSQKMFMERFMPFVYRYKGDNGETLT